MAVEEMRRQKLTMKALSRKADLGDTTVQYILRHSTTVNLETLRRLANALASASSILLTACIAWLCQVRRSPSDLLGWTIARAALHLERGQAIHDADL
jgi:hypothetical protein